MVLCFLNIFQHWAHFRQQRYVFSLYLSVLTVDTKQFEIGRFSVFPNRLISKEIKTWKELGLDPGSLVQQSNSVTQERSLNLKLNFIRATIYDRCANLPDYWTHYKPTIDNSSFFQRLYRSNVMVNCLKAKNAMISCLAEVQFPLQEYGFN